MMRHLDVSRGAPCALLEWVCGEHRMRGACSWILSGTCVFCCHSSILLPGRPGPNCQEFPRSIIIKPQFVLLLTTVCPTTGPCPHQSQNLRAGLSPAGQSSRDDLRGYYTVLVNYWVTFKYSSKQLSLTRV